MNNKAHKNPVVERLDSGEYRILYGAGHVEAINPECGVKLVEYIQHLTEENKAKQRIIDNLRKDVAWAWPYRKT